MTFVETLVFTKNLAKYLHDEEYWQLQLYLMNQPSAGDIIQGAGGLRKLRWLAKGKGKREGVRIIYYWKMHTQKIYLMSIYAKNEVADLSAKAKKILKQMLEDL